MSTSFKPDLEMKSIRSLISDVFISDGLAAPELDAVCFLLEDFDVLLLMVFI
jgi:hypothetical protein